MNVSAYALSAWLLGKGIALCYMVAFFSLAMQVMGLYGQNGILSIHQFIHVLRQQTGGNRFRELPTLFWWNASDFFLNFVAFAGLLASSLAFLGFCPPLMFLIAWVCYLSFVNAGQDFLGFQWDTLLLEAGFLSIFLFPWHFSWAPWAAYEPNVFVRWLFWILIFKLMFLSGTVKLISKDPTWRNFTALDYHYWTQPIPNVMAYVMAKLPRWFHKASCLMMFGIELGISFFVFLPGPFREVAALAFLLLQFIILASGNYAFFNFLTVFLCLFLVGDDRWQPVMTDLFSKMTVISDASWAYHTVALVLFVVMVPLNLFWFALTFRENSKYLNSFLPIIRAVYNFRINSSYGLFAVMTKERPELVLQGSNDNETWQEYEFKYKPGSLDKMPPFVAPNQPRLDWQMWFAALGTFNQNLWLQNLMARIFMNSGDVLGLLKNNPFPATPQYLRLVKYKYTFSDRTNLMKRHEWWQREYVGLYSPVFEKSDFVDAKA